MSCDVIGDGEEDEWVKNSLKLGTLLVREKRAGGGRGSHDELRRRHCRAGKMKCVVEIMW
jgi:hypothetical protein